MRSILVAAALCLSACGGPNAGDACTPNGAMACGDSDEGFECRGGSLKAIPCKGPGGCVASSTRVSCDTSGNIAGDGCATSQEGTAFCSVANSKQMLTCSSFILRATDCPSACVISGGKVGCI